MKSILCFGDSNTWGYVPGSGARFGWEQRWTGLLQRHLGDGARVIEEGLSGRTTVFEDPLEEDRSGRKALPMLLQTHSPLDLLVIMLGTNDVKARFALTPFSVAMGAAELVEIALRSGLRPEQVLLVSPPFVEQTNRLADSLAFEGALEKSRELAKHYQYFAETLHCRFFDAATLVKSSQVDGIHWEAEEHRKFALAMTELVKVSLGGEGMAS